MEFTVSKRFHATLTIRAPSGALPARFPALFPGAFPGAASGPASLSGPATQGTKETIMDVPLEIAFHNLERSEFVEERVRERAAKLEKLFPRLVSCRVVIEANHRHQRHGHGHRVRIDMKVPGDELVVSKEPETGRDNPTENDVYLVLREAFDAAERRLKDYKESHSRRQQHHPAA